MTDLRVLRELLVTELEQRFFDGAPSAEAIVDALLSPPGSPFLEIVGTLTKQAEKVPDYVSDDIKLGWRTGYQNAISDLIEQLWPGANGGRRLSYHDILAEDLRRTETGAHT